MANNHVARPLISIIETFMKNPHRMLNMRTGLPDEELVSCPYCGYIECDGYIGNCPDHPEKVAAREERWAEEAKWEEQFARGWNDRKIEIEEEL